MTRPQKILIAEFMGLKQAEDSTSERLLYLIPIASSTEQYEASELPYDWNFNRILEVLQKIGKLSPYVILPNIIRISDAGIHVNSEDILEMFQKAIILYIEWYNEQENLRKHNHLSDEIRRAYRKGALEFACWSYPASDRDMVEVMFDSFVKTK